MSQIPNYFARQPVSRLSPTATAPVQQQGRFGDAVDAFQAGGLSAVGGIFDFVGADGIAKQFYGWSDAQQDTMSDRGKSAMGKSFFDENEQGETVIGEGLTDIDTWLLTLANVAGQFVPTAIPGAGAAGAVAKAASLGAKGRAAANVVAMGATGGAAATGQGMEQAREEVRNMPDAVLAESPLFRDVFKGIYQSKPDWTDEQKWDAAKDAIAAKVAEEVRSDPKVLLANFGAAAIGDPIIGRALMGARLAKSGALRSAAKGFVAEGSTEAAQAGVSQYGINQALQPLDNRDAMQGVTTAALNEGVAGGGFGAGAGLLGGIANRQQPEQPVEQANNVQPEPVAPIDPAVAAIAETNPGLAAELNTLDQKAASRKQDVQGLLDIPTAARNAGFGGNPQDVGRFGDLLTSPVQQSIEQMRAQTVADLVAAAAAIQAPTPQDRFSPAQYQFEGEVLPADRQQSAGALPGATIPGEQARFIPDRRIEGEYQQPIRTTPRPQGITDKGIIFAGDNRPAQQSQERADNAQRQAQQFADNARSNYQPRIQQKDIIFAGNESGVTVKQSGKPFQSPKEALASKGARDAKRAGQQVEAVPFADGFGWRVVAPNITEQAPSISAQATDTNVGTTLSDQAAVTPSPETDTAPSNAQEAQAMPAAQGKQARTYTPSSNKPIDVEYRVVEADSLVTSNDFAGAVNPDYPAEMQPRNRSRQAYQVQVSNIAKNPIADKLLESPDTDRGAPVVRNGVVESGNGRSIGLREAYRTGKAEAYKQALIERAELLGIDPQQVAGMRNPVLVRERLTELSPAELREFTVDSNQSAGVEQSPAELARTDASLIDDALMAQLAIPENGDVLSPANDRFVRGFAAMLGNNEVASYKQADGQWNKAFKDRLLNAIFAKGYDNADLLTSISESTNPESKNLLAALMNVAGKLGAIRSMDRDIGSSLSGAFAEAAGLVTRARREGTTIDAIDAQADMLTGHTDADIVALAKELDGMIRSGKRMTALLDNIANTVLTDTQNMGQTDIFTGEPGARPNVNEVIRNAAGKQQQADTTRSPGLFDGPEIGRGDTTEQQSIPQDTGERESESQPGYVSQEAEPDTNQTPADAGVSVSEAEQNEPSAPIDDFGEKIGGARKDVWGGFSDAINSDASTAELPLSKSFPEPDYVRMAADGVPMETLALIAAMRAEIPTKPRDSYKVRRWAEKVDVLRGFAASLINGQVELQDVLAQMLRSSGEMAAIAEAIPAIAKANPETLKLAAKYRLDSGAFTMFKGKDYKPAKVFYFPKHGRSEMLSLASDDKQQALDSLSMLIQKEAEANPSTAGKKHSNIAVYINRQTKQPYLGWKGASGVLRIKSFETANEARDYLKNNRDEVEAELKRLKDTPDMRRAENRTRTGPERYAGNVTPAIFADTFGFRGVEFGNWVEQGRRQKDLNEAYDALMDLADVLGVPPKALALNGELGMAFGSRGKGGKQSAAAHYERDYVAINMTKESGAGSLAHEWWHAVDNYFARMVGKPAAFATDGSGVRGDAMRKEVRAAFDDVMSAIRRSGLIKRSANLDVRRSKPYWSTTQEASARSFEAFVISELESKGFSNDYLANILEPEAWNALEEMQGNLPDQTYPYPTTDEQASINPAFRKLFDTLQTRETDKGTMLFSRTQVETESFKKWFGNSKVVDANGEPLVMYHGTASDFSEFSKPKAQDKDGRRMGMGWGKGKFYFADNGLAASSSAEFASITGRGDQPNVMPVYLRIEKPIMAADYMQLVRDEVATGKTRDQAIAAVDKQIKQQGFDGIIDTDTGGYAVFEPGQIKSATGNNGDFDSTNPDIQFAAGNYSAMRNQKGKGVPTADVERMVQQFMKRINGGAGIKVKVLRNQQEAELEWNMSLRGSIVRGAYNDKDKTAYLIAGNFADMEQARRTLAHEVIAHGGLQSVIGAKTYRDFLDRINATRTRASFRPAWNGIMKDYGDLTPEKQAEEFFARWVEDQPETGSLKYWWKALLRWLNGQLAKVGVTRAENADVAAMRDMLDSIVQGFKSGRAPRRQQGKAVAFDKGGEVTETPSFKRWFGDSKVVDKDGKPLVVYHGSPDGGITVFDTTGKASASAAKQLGTMGAYFTKSPSYAQGYAGMSGVVYPVYISMQNPLMIPKELNTNSGITAALKRLFSKADQAVLNDMLDPLYVVKKGATANLSPETVSALKQAGYDGIINERYNEIVVLDSNQVKSAVGNNGDFDPTNPDIMFSRTAEPDTRTAKEKLGLGEQADETLKEKATARYRETADTLKSSKFWQRLNEGIFDGMAGIKQAEVSVGVTDPNKQGYVSARLASGLADVLHGVFHYGAPEWKNGVVARKADTKGLLEVFGSLGDELNNWLAWMGANRAEKLMAEGRENNLTSADIAELKALAAGKEEQFEAVRQEYNKINSAIIDLAQQAGLISEAQRSGFDEEWYVPFFRDMDVDPEMEGIAAMVHGPKSKQGIANQSAQLKELKGGAQSTKDLLENIIQRHSTLIDAALKNNAMLEIVGNLSGTDFMQPVTSPEIAALSQTELNLLSKVKVMRDGKAEAYTVSDPALLRGLLQINDAGSKSLFNRIGRSAKRFLTAGITLSPDFIVKNFVRDAAHAWMVNKDDFKFGADSVKGLRKAFKEDEAYRDLIFSGAAFQGGYVHGADPEAAAQQVRRALKAKGLTVNEVNSYMDSLVTKGSQLLERYRNASDKVENANRLSTYEAALAAGKSARQAAFEAKDLMDYSLKGNFALIGSMIDFLPFFNARLQGLSKLVRAAKAGDGDRVLKVLSANLAMKGMKVAAFSLALAAMNNEDERYQELADWDKDANWHFWLGDDHIRIPKPFELGIIFGTFPERMLHYGTGAQPASDLGKAVGHAVFNTLALNPIPQLALPAVEVMVNRSFFQGKEIEGMADENRRPEDRYNAYTSEVAKQLGQLFNVSPKKIEHLVTGYTGTIGGYVLGASDIVARQMLGIESADTPISRYPVIKAFYQGDAPKTNTKFQQEFYDALNAANQAYGSYKRAAEEGNTERQQALLEDNSDKLRSRVQLNRLQRQLSELNKQAERVNNNSALTGAQKREQLDAITRRKNAIYHAVYVRFNLGEW